MITDTNGNPLAGAIVTATVAKGLNGAKEAHDVHVTTVANGHFTIGGVPVANVVNNNGTATGGALTLSVEAPTVGSGYMSATVRVFPQAQVTSTETGGSVSGEGNPQAIWFDNFNADAGTIQLPGFIATITGTLRNATTGAAMGNVPMRATFETVELDQCPGGHNDTTPGSCSDAPPEAVIVTYASGATYLPDNNVTAADGTFFFHNLPDNSCIRIYAPGLNFVLPPSSGATSEDFGGAICLSDDGDEAASVGFLPISTADDFVQLNRVFANNSPNGDQVGPFVVSVGNVTDTVGGCTISGATTGVNSGTFSSAQGDTITVHFSEPVVIDPALLGATPANPVTVLVGTPPNLTTLEVESVAVGADGRSLVITTVDPVPLASQVIVQIPIEAVADASGNPLTTNPGISFDTTSNTLGSGGSIENIVLDLCFNVFQPGSTNADSPNVVQVDAQADLSSVAPFLDTNSFLDTVLSGAPGFSDATDNVGGTVAAAAVFPANVLEALNADVLVAGTAAAPPQTTTPLQDLLSAVFPGEVSNPDVARVRVTPPATNVPVDYVVFVTRPGVGVIDSLIFASNGAENIGAVCNGTTAGGATCASPKAAGPAVSLGNGHFRYVIVPADPTEPFDLLITGTCGPSASTTACVNDGSRTGTVLQPGDHVIVQARASNGILGGSFDLALHDNDRPTTTLQQIANGTVLPANLSLINASAGGALGDAANGQHLVVYPVSPQSLDKNDPNRKGTPPANTGFNCDTLFQELQSSNYTTGEVGALRALDPTPAPNPCGTTAGLTEVADATSTAAFFASSPINLAVAFTEPLSSTLTGTPALDTANGTSLAFTGGNNGVINNTTTENGAIFSLIRFTVGTTANDIHDLEADGQDTHILDFCGVVADASGLEATCPAGSDPGSNARVLIHDFKPPLMTRAFRTAQALTFEFDEPIDLTQDGVPAQNITLLECAGGPVSININADQTGIPAASGNRITTSTTSAGGTRVVVPIGNPQVPGNLTSCFNSGSGGSHAYAEAAYDGITPTQPAAPNHGAVIYDTVADTAGNAGAPFSDNTWADWETLGAGISAPMFAAADLLGPFQIASVSCNVNTTTHVVNTCTLMLTHQLNLAGPITADSPEGGAACDTPVTCTGTEVSAYLASLFQITDSAGGGAIFVAPTNAQCSNAAGVSVTDNTCVSILLNFAGQAVPGGNETTAELRFVLNGGSNTNALNLQSFFDQSQLLGNPGTTTPIPGHEVCKVLPILADLTTTDGGIPAECNP